MKDNIVRVYKQPAEYHYVDEHNTEISSFLFQDWKDKIKPGQTVVIKPNFVKESHLYKSDEWDYVITHPSIIKLVLENVVRLLDNCGEIFIVDAPQTDSDYNAIIRNTKLQEIVSNIQIKTAVKISYFDLREERWLYRQGIIVKKEKLPGDPHGYVKINLNNKSEFYGKVNTNYYGADYDMQETSTYHNDTDNIYVVSKTILSADVFINLPKLKTHKLGGVTISLKNLVGTCVVKNSIPHHTLGSPENNGDKFPRETEKNKQETKLKNLALRLLRKKNPLINYPFILIKQIAGIFFGKPHSDTIRNGSWYGNDTIWRSILDLNKILLYADKNGIMQDTPQREYISVVDGIIGGEGKGPMEPDPKYSGVIIAGYNPVYVDTVGATLMGYDYSKITSIREGYNISNYPLCDQDVENVEIISNLKIWNKPINQFRWQDSLQYQPHFGWKGHIELP